MSTTQKRYAIFRVEMELPPCATLHRCRDYITSALKAERGALHPEDPMASFDNATLRVSGGRMLWGRAAQA